MDYKRFYGQLFKPIEDSIGPIDPETIFWIIGFDSGGPVNLCTVGRGQADFVTFVSCELAVRDGQQVGAMGPFEVMMTCDDEQWTNKILTNLGQMSFDSMIEHGHTIDIGEIVEANCPLQGLVTEEFARVRIDGRNYGILRFHGVTRRELEFAINTGADRLLDRLKSAGIFPRTSVKREKSVV